MSVLSDARVVNLDRSTDRMRRFKAANAHLGAIPRFSALDGAKIDRAALEREGMITRCLKYGPGTIGCSLSHIALWRNVLERQRSLTIFEDDAVTVEDFDAYATRVLNSLGNRWDFVLWGCCLNPSFAWVDLGVTRTCLHVYGAGRMSGLATGVAAAPIKLLHAFGLHAYSVSPSGALAGLKHCLPLRHRLINFPDAGVTIEDAALDMTLCGLYPSINAYLALPFIATTDNSNSDRIQTDRAAEEIRQLPATVVDCAASTTTYEARNASCQR